MPTYSYACTECGNRFDVTQAFTDDALTTCEKCSGRLRKIYGSVGVVFKGSGFYRTDSRDSGKSSPAGSGSGGSPAGSGDGGAEKSAGTASEKPAKASEGAGDKPAAKAAEKATSAAASVAG